jgi:hypothetical protein
MARFFFSVWRLRVSLYGTPSLTRWWVCNLHVQLLLGLARAVALGSKSRRTHDHILLSHLRLPQLGGPGPRIYIPQEQGGPVIPLGTGFPSVASYDSQSYGGGILTRLHTGSDLEGEDEGEDKLWRMFSLPVCLGVARFLFSAWQLRVSWCGALSLTRGLVCNLLLLLGFVSAVPLVSKSSGL